MFEFATDCQLMASDCSDLVDDVVKIQLALVVVRLAPLSSDKHKKVWLVLSKVFVFKLPDFDVCVCSERALRDLRDLVEAIHVELADKGGEVVVLEVLWQDMVCALLRVRNF